jgi:hypothetical protein
MFGSPKLGQAAGDWLGRITGMGAYAVSKNSLYQPNQAQGPPVFNPGSEVIVNKREYLADVITSATAGNFSLASYAINPGLNATFPWLSALANNFEQYSIEGMVFEFKSTSAMALNSVNTALGTVIMATNYDVADPNFISKQQMEMHQYSTSCAPSVSMIHPIECAKNEKILSNLYNRSTAVASGDDLRFYDFGNFQIATVGMQGTSVNIGELWISYSIKLLKPRLPSAISSVGGVAHLALTGATTSFPIGATLAYTSGFNSPLNSITLSSGVVSLSPGQYVVFLLATSATSYTFGSATLGSGVSRVNAFNNAGSSSLLSGSGTTQCFSAQSILVTQSNATITYSATVVGTTQVDLYILSVPVGFQTKHPTPRLIEEEKEYVLLK